MARGSRSGGFTLTLTAATIGFALGVLLGEVLVAPPVGPGGILTQLAWIGLWGLGTATLNAGATIAWFRLGAPPWWKLWLLQAAVAAACLLLYLGLTVG